MDWKILSIISVTLLLIIAFIYTDVHEQLSCESKGGKMIGTGNYIDETTFIMSGKVMVPITNRVEEQKCSK